MDTNEFELRKFVAPEFIFGMDARFLAGRYAKNLGASKVLLVTDPGVMAAGRTADVLTCLHEVGLGTAVYTAVTSNPKTNPRQPTFEDIKAIYERAL